MAEETEAQKLNHSQRIRAMVYQFVYHEIFCEIQSSKFKTLD